MPESQTDIACTFAFPKVKLKLRSHFRIISPKWKPEPSVKKNVGIFKTAKCAAMQKSLPGALVKQHLLQF